MHLDHSLHCPKRADGRAQCVCGVIPVTDPVSALEQKIRKMRMALEAADACFDALDPREPSGLSDAETATLFNSAREAVRLALQ